MGTAHRGSALPGAPSPGPPAGALHEGSCRLKKVKKSVAKGKSATLKLKPAKSKDAKKIAKALKKGKKAKAKLTDEAENKKGEELSVKLKR